VLLPAPEGPDDEGAGAGPEPRPATSRIAGRRGAHRGGLDLERALRLGIGRRSGGGDAGAAAQAAPAVARRADAAPGGDELLDRGQGLAGQDRGREHRPGRERVLQDEPGAERHHPALDDEPGAARRPGDGPARDAAAGRAPGPRVQPGQPGGERPQHGEADDRLAPALDGVRQGQRLLLQLGGVARQPAVARSFATASSRSRTALAPTKAASRGSRIQIARSESGSQGTSNSAATAGPVSAWRRPARSRSARPAPPPRSRPRPPPAPEPPRSGRRRGPAGSPEWRRAGPG
jgi:hypothetical protein